MPAGKQFPRQDTFDEKVLDVKLSFGGEIAVGPSKKGWRFWMVFLAICASLFLSAIEMVGESCPVFPSLAHFHDLRRPFRRRSRRSSRISRGTTSFGSRRPIHLQRLHYCLPPVVWPRQVTAVAPSILSLTQQLDFRAACRHSVIAGDVRSWKCTLWVRHLYELDDLRTE